MRRKLFYFLPARFLKNLAGAGYAFIDFKPKLSRDKNRIAPVEQIEQSGSVASAEFEHIPKSFSRDESNRRSGPLKQSINDKRRAVLEQGRVFQRDLCFLKTIDDPFNRVVMGRQAFRVANPAVGGVKTHKIGERAAGINGH